MRIFAIGLLALLQVFAVSACLAKPPGTVKLRLNGTTDQMTIPEGTGGTDSDWAVGPVSILAVGPGGASTLRLTFDEIGKGSASGATIGLHSRTDQVWTQGQIASTITLTRAANIPPDFGIAGSLSGWLGHKTQIVTISGSSKAVLPRQDFAQTPPDN